MLDDLRNSANASFLYEEEEAGEPIALRNPPKNRPLLGMSAPQRFVLSLMLFLSTTVFGLLLLLLTGKIAPF